jgi:hypothetical protein
MRHVNKAARMSLHHRMIQHRSAIRWVEARTLASERVFPRHSHDQLGIGIMVSGAHRSWSGIGNVEAHVGDIIMVNPGEMHDGLPLGGGLREWRMLYFDPALVTEFVEAEGVTGIEVIRPRSVTGYWRPVSRLCSPASSTPSLICSYWRKTCCG